MSYKDARPWAKAIKEDVLTKKMPPWFADPQYGHFADDRSLSKQEIDTWSPGWMAARRKAIRRTRRPAHVYRRLEHSQARSGAGHEYVPHPGQGRHPVSVRGAAHQVHHDQWIQAAEARPSDRSVVHHVVIFVRQPEIQVAARSQARRSVHASRRRQGFQQYLRRRQRRPDDLHARKNSRDVAAWPRQDDPGRFRSGAADPLHHQRQRRPWTIPRSAWCSPRKNRPSAPLPSPETI